MASQLSIALVAPTETDSPVSGMHSGNGYIAHVRSFFDIAGIAHLLTDDCSKADLIMVLEPCNIRNYRRYAKDLSSHPCIRANPERCYTYNAFDRPWPILPGMYVSLPESLANRWLHCGGPHLDYPNKFAYGDSGCSAEAALQAGRLACFRGSPTSKLRVRLLKAAEMGMLPPEIKVCKTIGGYFSNGEEGQRTYCKEIHEHAFSLAPGGHGPSSFRLYESMALGRAPVIIADSWMPPKGIKWSECSLMIPERDIMNLGRILTDESPRCSSLGTNARTIYEENFSPPSVMKYIIRTIEDLHRGIPFPQHPAWRLDLIDQASRSAPALPISNKIIRSIRRMRRIASGKK